MRIAPTRRRDRPLPFGASLPDANAIGDALCRLIKAEIPLDGASDHRVSEVLYLRDPDGNGVELYWDWPQEQVPRTPDGGLAMFTHALDLEALPTEGPDRAPRAMG